METPNIYRFWYTHNLEAEGFGRKTHLGTVEPHKIFCGLGEKLFSIPQGVDKEWIEQPDPDGELCSRCKKSALKMLNNL